MMNSNDCTRDVVIVGVAVDYVVAEALCVWLFFLGRLFSDEAAAIVIIMVEFDAAMWCIFTK
jgi:hypothetical protein